MFYLLFKLLRLIIGDGRIKNVEIAVNIEHSLPNVRPVARIRETVNYDSTLPVISYSAHDVDLRPGYVILYHITINLVEKKRPSFVTGKQTLVMKDKVLSLQKNYEN